MKNFKVYKSFMLVVSLITVFVFQSMADNTPNVKGYILGGTGGWSYRIMVGPANNSNNPNLFSSVMVLTQSGGTQQQWGFLLDGSENSKEWLKMLRDAAATNKKIALLVDDNYSNGYVQVATNLYYGMGKLLNVGIFNDQ